MTKKDFSEFIQLKSKYRHSYLYKNQHDLVEIRTIFIKLRKIEMRKLEHHASAVATLEHLEIYLPEMMKELRKKYPRLDAQTYRRKDLVYQNDSFYIKIDRPKKGLLKEIHVAAVKLLSCEYGNTDAAVMLGISRESVRRINKKG